MNDQEKKILKKLLEDKEKLIKIKEKHNKEYQKLEIKKNKINNH